jgi:hypothetical protein
MPSGPQTAIWTRKEWQDKKAAEKPKVPSGVHPKVNVGELLDKFEKANKKSYELGAKAADDLIAGLKSYSAEAKKKYPNWAKRVDNSLVPMVGRYLEGFAKVGAATKKYPELYKKASLAAQSVGAEFIAWEKGGKKGEFVPSKAKPARQVFKEFSGVLEFAPVVSDKVKDVAVRNFATAVGALEAKWDEHSVQTILAVLPKLPPKL